MTAAVALPVLSGSGCSGLDLLDPVCQTVNGVGSSIAGAGADAILQAVSNWVVAGAGWLLEQIGGVMNATTAVDLKASWFQDHYVAMTALAGVVILPMAIATVFQAIYRQSTAVLVRSFLVQLPLALLFMGVAVELVQLSLSVTDELSRAVGTANGTDLQSALSGMADALEAQGGGLDPSVPAFVTLLAGMLVATGAFALWLELLVRSAAVYVAVLFLPLVLASTVWPAISHWCRRLVDTLVALILSKFVIVAVLSLGASELGSANGFSTVLGGAAMLLLAAFTPFTLLRLVPIMEHGAAQQLEGARHRMQSAASAPPRTAASFALRQYGAFGAGGEPGTGLASGSGLLSQAGGGAGGVGVSRLPDPSSGARGSDGGIAVPLWPGLPDTNVAFEEAMATGRNGGIDEDRPDPSSLALGTAATPVGVRESRAPEHGLKGYVERHVGSHHIGRDAMGPVIRWTPVGGSPDAASARDPHRPDGGGRVGG
jgi:hypothetical protein